MGLLCSVLSEEEGSLEEELLLLVFHECLFKWATRFIKHGEGLNRETLISELRQLWARNLLGIHPFEV